jgi:uncharacterized protein (DUF2147 family)
MITLLMGLAAAVAPNADGAIGRWKTQTKNGIVEIARCGESICGKLVTSDGLKANPDMLDSENADPKLRTRKLVGMPMMGGFKRDGAAWSGGWLYKADDGKTYKGTVTPTDAAHLQVKGCIVWPLCKSQTWTRVD